MSDEPLFGGKTRKAIEDLFWPLLPAHLDPLFRALVAAAFAPAEGDGRLRDKGEDE